MGRKKAEEPKDQGQGEERTFSVTGLVRSLNKPAKPIAGLVRASSPEEARQKGQRALERKAGAKVEMGSVREGGSGGPVEPQKPRRWGLF
ncbi:hypothetical protein [Streptomyces sp. NRRL S-350]|uniref:hypothetical protein n=1 Tax=Streptomyces sp. NRRL S-350 TaxID=1463902 RepID=UPI0004BFA311|nr:hypothetical protein [Streptomyces sp. NRRL S-350]